MVRLQRGTPHTKLMFISDADWMACAARRQAGVWRARSIDDNRHEPAGSVLAARWQCVAVLLVAGRRAALLRWQISNAAVEMDHAANRKITKKRSTGHVDGVVALLMALGAASQAAPKVFDVQAMIA